MRGDRVQITIGTLCQNTKDALVYVYKVKLDENGVPLRAYDGSVQVESAGGVKDGCTGVIVGPPEKVHRTQLKDNKTPLGMHTNDFVNVFPVMLDYYQQLGWFPVENIRVLSGGVA